MPQYLAFCLVKTHKFEVKFGIKSVFGVKFEVKHHRRIHIILTNVPRPWISFKDRNSTGIPDISGSELILRKMAIAQVPALRCHITSSQSDCSPPRLCFFYSLERDSLFPVLLSSIKAFLRLLQSLASRVYSNLSANCNRIKSDHPAVSTSATGSASRSVRGG